MSNETLLVEIIAILKKYTTIPALLKKTYTNFPCVKTITYLQLETTLNAIQIKSSVENKQLVHLFYITIKPLIIQAPFAPASRTACMFSLLIPPIA